jgi:hypothetical protein
MMPARFPPARPQRRRREFMRERIILLYTDLFEVFALYTTFLPSTRLMRSGNASIAERHDRLSYYRLRPL